MPRAIASHRVGRMNGLEAEYEARLKILRAAGEIADFWFEEFKLRLADRTWYTPDFLVQYADGTLEFVEVKGHWRDDARVKWKTAAEKYPLFKWTAAQKKRGSWETETYGREGGG